MNAKIIIAVTVALLAVVGFVTVSDSEDVSATTDTDISAAFEDGGSLTLTSNVTINGGTVQNDLQLDLNGYIITTTDKIVVNANLTIKDSGEYGMIYSTISSDMISVTSPGSLTIESGTFYLDNEAWYTNTIYAEYADVTVNGGTIIREGIDEGTDAGSSCIKIRYSDLVIEDAVLVSNNNGVTATGFTSYDEETKIATGEEAHAVIRDSQITAKYYGVAIFGYKGANDTVTVDLYDNIVEAGVGISSNASSGKYAGFTINVYSGTFTGENGIYGPGDGLYNITGGTFDVTGTAIRAVSGVYNISGDVEIRSSASLNHQGISGTYPGPTHAAIVVGKVSTGYPGNIVINIDGGFISNTGGGDAIIVYDDHLSSDNYSSVSYEINANGGMINGDIQLLTTQSKDPESDSISFTLNGSEIQGNIIQDDGNDVTITLKSGYISGDVPDDVEVPTVYTVYLDYLGASIQYFGDRFTLPSNYPADRDDYIFLGLSLDYNSTTAQYQPGDVVTGVSGDLVVYAVWEYTGVPPWIYDDDDDYVPIPPIHTVDEGDDDTVTIVACAAAAVVAAIMAVFLIVERKR